MAQGDSSMNSVLFFSYVLTSQKFGTYRLNMEQKETKLPPIQSIYIYWILPRQFKPTL